MTDREKLEIWLDDPSTPEDEWMRLTFPKIDEQAGSDDACKVIPQILAKRMGKSVSEVRKMRNKFRCEHGLPWSRC